MSADCPTPHVPATRPDDSEDVSWSLSTAAATWARGEHAEALKWVRRAAEAASLAEEDERALELAKAAADLAGVLKKRESLASLDPDELVPASVKAPPPLPSAPPPLPSAPPPPTSMPRHEPAPVDTRRDLGDVARARDELGETDENMAVKTPSLMPEAERRTVVGPPRNFAGALERATGARSAPPRAGGANRLAATSSTPPLPAERRSPSGGGPHDPAIATAQAVRVLVWRDASGVRVAPAGTVVSALTLDAVLVALDPGADLTAWLSASPPKRR